MAANGAALSPSDIAEAIAGAAKRLRIALYSDDEIVREAENIIRRVEAELESLQRAGETEIGQSFIPGLPDGMPRRAARKCAPYAEWLNKYRANLVRQLAAALRDA